MDIGAYAVAEEDRATFVQFMALIARADGTLAPEELQAIDSAMMAWNLSAEEREDVMAVVDDGCEIQVLAERIQNPRTPYLLVQELVTLAHLDDHYDDAEQAAVQAIASAVGVSGERLAAIEKWVRDGIAWRSRGLELTQTEA